MPARVFITVAEASADQHAGSLARALRERVPNIQMEGLGGQAMRDAGVIVHHDTVTNAAMGLRAILRASEISRLLKWTQRHLDERTFDLHICCDSWSMNWHFARQAKARGIPVLYYIAPQTWASREGRIKKLRAHVDELACILPFEEKYFRSHDVKATYVGHPLFDALPRGRTDVPPAQRFPNRPPVIGILPGSRRSVASANFPRLLKVMEILHRAFPDAQFLIPTTASTHDIVADWVAAASWIEFARDAFDEFVPQCDLCITVSGTAALHVAAYHVPLVVVYYGNPLLWHLVGRWIVKARTYSLVNILSGQPDPIAREFIPWYGSVKPVARYVMDLLNHPEQLETARAELARMIWPLDKPGASRNVAKIAQAMLRPDSEG